ncbi:MAG: DUF6531 domain-containing protein, partial [Exilibacterium sp.]
MASVLSLLFILPCLLVTSIAHAGDSRGTASDGQGGPPDTECEPPDEPDSGGPGCGGGNSGAGDPIHTLTGNSYQMVPVFRGGGEFPLRFRWHYNSRMRPKTDFAYFYGNWTYSYSDHLDIESDRITLAQESGRRIVFDVDGSDITLTLRNSSTAIFGALSFDGTFYRYQGRSRLTYLFDTSGQLLEVSDTHGVKHTVSEEAQGEGKVVTVTHSNGQTIQLVFEHVDDALPHYFIDPQGTEYSFDVDEVDGLQRLQSVTFPKYQNAGDSLIQFNYLEQRNNPSPDWLYRTALKSIVDEEGWQKAHWNYSDEGYAIQSYLGNADEATDIVDLVPVEAEGTTYLHHAYITNAYGCRLVHTYHSHRAGQAYPVLPWLNRIDGDDTSEGCDMLGKIKHYSNMLESTDTARGGLGEAGYPNIFSNNVFDEYSGWQADIRKNTEYRQSYLSADGQSKVVVRRDIYTYHPEHENATNIKRYQDLTEASLWQEIQYSYYDGQTDPVNNG